MATPNLIGGYADMQAKLEFLRRVTGMSNDNLNKAGPLFSYSLDCRMRARYYYALL